MADEVIIDKTAEQLALENKTSEAEKRIKQLSEKVRLTSEERDEKEKLLKETTEKLSVLEKENSFNSTFVDVLGTYSQAKDHRDEIKAKVLAGYTVEDATLAVLGKAGKLGGTLTPTYTPQVAGGSAATTMTNSANKEVKDMTQAERRAQLEKDLIWQ